MGHGLDIEAGISFGPVIEALTSLFARSRRRRLAPTSTTDAGVPGAYDADQCGAGRPPRGPSSDRFGGRGSGPVLLVLEDMHWADESTRDLVVALSRTARGRLMFVVSVRNDDLPRGHPARKALAEIGQVPGGRRVQLHPLDRAGIAGIVASASGKPTDPALVRFRGRAFGRQPPVRRGDPRRGPMPSLRPAVRPLPRRVDALAEAPRDLVRTASVDGTRMDIDTLAEVPGIDPVRLDEFLRDLLDANVLRHEGDTLAFRHGLLREAVYDDLLPDERTR